MTYTEIKMDPFPVYLMLLNLSWGFCASTRLLWIFANPDTRKIHLPEKAILRKETEFHYVLYVHN